MTIRVLSFDFDGCLFCDAFIVNPDKKKSITDYNLSLYHAIKSSADAFSRTITMIGSHRQSFPVDKFNWFKPWGSISYYVGSCFTQMKALAKELSAEFDPFLMADIHSRVVSGSTFTWAMEHIDWMWAHCAEKNIEFPPEVSKEDMEHHPRWIFDSSKVSILYAQMHKIANENPDEDIVFEFFDDKKSRGSVNEDAVLDVLKNFFSKYPELIPDNVLLKLNQYEETMLTPVAEIVGTGFIDASYRETVMQMWEITLKAMGVNGSTRINVAKNVTPSLLTKRVAKEIDYSKYRLCSDTFFAQEREDELIDALEVSLCHFIM